MAAGPCTLNYLRKIAGQNHALKASLPGQLHRFRLSIIMEPMGKQLGDKIKLFHIEILHSVTSFVGCVLPHTRSKRNR